MAENPKPKKPGTTRIALITSTIFAVALVGIVVVYVVLLSLQKPIDANLFGLVSIVVGAIVGNIDRILTYFLGDTA